MTSHFIYCRTLIIKNLVALCVGNVHHLKNTTDGTFASDFFRRLCMMGGYTKDDSTAVGVRFWTIILARSGTDIAVPLGMILSGRNHRCLYTIWRIILWKEYSFPRSLIHFLYVPIVRVDPITYSTLKV